MATRRRRGAWWRASLQGGPAPSGPTVTIDKGSGQADPAVGGDVLFDVVFSEAVTGFADGDITLSGTAGATTAVVSGSGPAYTVTVSGMTATGTVIASIGAGVVTDVVDGLPNAASTSTDNSVSWTVPPVPVEFVAGFTVVNSGSVLFPSNAVWLPGDYIVASTRGKSGGTVTIPSWMTRIDGGAATDNPAIYVGRFPDTLAGVEEFGVISDSNVLKTGFVITNSVNNSTLTTNVSIYRNVDTSTPRSGFLVDAVTGASPNVGPLDIPDDGVAVLQGCGTYFSSNVAGGANFSGTGVSERSDVTDTSTDNYGRIYDKFGPETAYTFVETGVETAVRNDANIFWIVGLNPGFASYDPAATISYVGAGADTTATGTTITPPLPAGLQANDLLIAVVHKGNDGGGAFSNEAGWLRVGVEFTGSRAVNIFLKRALGGGSDTDPTFDTGNITKEAKVHAYRGVGGVSCEQGANSNTLTPARNTPVANCWALAAVASDFFQPISIGTANGYTSRGFVGSSGGGCGLADKSIAAAGAPGFPVFSASNSGFMSCYLLYLIPA